MWLVGVFFFGPILFSDESGKMLIRFNVYGHEILRTNFKLSVFFLEFSTTIGL
jgi:hypothetical protein